ncbi:MAG: class I SAM-dependent methyltransferase [Proteobacteria bacterium]|nr:class I SAM-dependent methyltransferase [Pseudomonadota bacterium]
MKNVNKEKWDEIYKIKKQKGSFNKYPTEHIVVFIAKNYYKASDRSAIKILEIGCGSGCTLTYLAKEGFDAYGVDHSEYAIEMSKEFLLINQCSAQVSVQCATVLPYADNFFHACVESNSIHCNTTEDIRLMMIEIHRVLRPGGKFFGIFVSDRSDEFGKGRMIDVSTFDFSNTTTFRGQFDGFPVIHFFSRDEILDLAGCFSSCKLELDITTIETGSHRSPLGYWLVELRK